MDVSQVERRVFDAVWELVTRRVHDRATATGDLLHTLIHQQGSVVRRGEDLCAGRIVLNRDRALLASVAEATGLGLVVYLGNRRIATATVPEAGIAPKQSTAAAPRLVDAVLRRRETFKGRVDYDTRTYLVTGRPLLRSGNDADPVPLGMIEVFQDEEVFRDLLAAAARTGLQDQTSDVVARSDALESILQFIDDIARRLQLLALNGNIIAAQAPEHGRAFRVVCRELGTLAAQARSTGDEVRQLAATMGLEGIGDPYADLAPARDPVDLPPATTEIAAPHDPVHAAGSGPHRSPPDPTSLPCALDGPSDT
ncbi:MAG: methyl-accepting chemotaxis protein [Nannocystaceae bacterium]